MKILKICGYIFFVLSIIVVMVAFEVSTSICDVVTFGMPGMLKYTWIMWLFIPIGIVSIALGICLKKRNAKYLKNVIAGGIAVFLLLAFGSFRFIFANQLSYDRSGLTQVEAKIEYQLPANVEVASLDIESFKMVYAQITSESEKLLFDKQVQEDNLWTRGLSPSLEAMLPAGQRESELYEYFIFYNETLREFNTVPSRSGTYKCLWLMYNTQKGNLQAVFNYNAQFVI